MKAPNFYAAGGIDRVGHKRKDPSWVADHLKHPESRFLPVWRTQNLLIALGRPPRAGLLMAEEIIALGGEPILLGLLEGRAYFAVDISEIDAPLEKIGAPEGAFEFTDLRRVGPLLPREDASLLAYARALAYWHSRHRFCNMCGSPSRSEEAGHVRRCASPACNTLHFPRTDPAVIMLVHNGDRCLLGRQKSWPAGMHSTLAGFVEPGESLEEAVAREVFEEAGIEVDEVDYSSSQPWPFPASIMLGFHARARGDQITIDPHELQSAAWFDRDFILAHHADTDDFRLPRRDSISRRLIEEWVSGAT